MAVLRDTRLKDTRLKDLALAAGQGVLDTFSPEKMRVERQQHNQSVDNTIKDAALDWLIQQESEGKVWADNPKSSAFGVGQLLKSNRKTYGQKLGFDPDTIDYNEQLQMMREYIKDRYGTPQKAMEFHKIHGYY